MCLGAFWTGSAQTRFYDAAEFHIGGQGPWTPASTYSRLPGGMESTLREPLVILGNNSSGLYVRFRTDSRRIAAKWSLKGNTVMNHMTFVGIKGLDLYALEPDGWRFVNTGRPIDRTTTADIISNLDGAMREYMLYLPLYDGVEELSIGVDSTAVISKPRVASPIEEHPIVVYGTSITQGACASRPGMSYTAILSRRFDREVLNFGFSGNAKLDEPIAQLLATIPSPSIYLLDFVPNCTVELIEQKMQPFVECLRAAHPEVPIVIVEGPKFPHAFFDTSIRDYLPAKNAALYAGYKALKRSGMKNIHYIRCDKLVGDDREASVDGIHFTDIGFMRFAETVAPVVGRLLK